MSMKFKHIAYAALLILSSQQTSFPVAAADAPAVSTGTPPSATQPEVAKTPAALQGSNAPKAPDISQDAKSPATAKPPETSQDFAAPTTDEPKASETFLNQTIVTVNGQPITGHMFRTYLEYRMRKMSNTQMSPQSNNMAINELITIVLVSQAAIANNFDTRPQVVAMLNLQRSQLLYEELLREKLANAAISEDALQQAYKKEYGTPSNEYKAAHILVKSEDEAKAIIAQLAQGGDFAALAKKHSTDSTAEQGGDLGWFDAAQMVKPFADALVALKPKTTTTVPVQTQFGWHVIKLEEQRPKPVPTFESVRPDLLAEEQRRVLTEYLRELHKNATIEMNAAFGRPAEVEAN